MSARQRTIPKISDVARAAGVSTATVSRALSRPETVAETTRKAVLDAAEATGYRINVAARNLRRQRTGAVMVLVPNLGNPFFSEILAGIETTLSRAGLSVLVADTRQAAGVDPVLDWLHNTRADGIIALDGSLSTQKLDAVLQAGLAPPVVFACEWPGDDRFRSVRSANRRGAGLGIDHLVGLGHRRIGHVFGPVGNGLTDARLEGMGAALGAHGLALPDSWRFAGDFTLASGAAAGRQWLALDDRPTAVFCASDLMACGFIAELHGAGFTTPRDVSVVGFDDIDIAASFLPPLTTIRQDRHALGQTAAQVLLSQIETAGDEPPAERVTVIGVELIVRGSTGVTHIRSVGRET